MVNRGKPSWVRVWFLVSQIAESLFWLVRNFAGTTFFLLFPAGSLAEEAVRSRCGGSARETGEVPRRRRCGVPGQGGSRRDQFLMGVPLLRIHGYGYG